MKPTAFLAAVTGLALLAGCGRRSPETPAAGAPLKITVQLDWVAEPEHGGFYQAQARGYFKEAGLEVELVPGGPNAFVMQKLASGQAQIGQADSTNTILATAQGLPVVQIGAVFQNDPSVLMLHADNPVSRFEELDGKTLMARPEWAFLPYLKKKYKIDFQLIPFNFSVTNFIANKDFIQQGYYIAEPYFIQKGGGKTPKYLYAWDAGFDAYAVLAANRAWAEQHPGQVRAFLQAYIRGWQDYLEGDPTPAHELMKQANPNVNDEFLMFSRGMIISEKLVVGRDNGGAGRIGRITRERFQRQIGQLEELGILAKDKVTVDDVMTTEYLP